MIDQHRHLAAVNQVHRLQDEVLGLQAQLSSFVALLVSVTREYGLDNRLVLSRARLEACGREANHLDISTPEPGDEIVLTVVVGQAPPAQPQRPMVEVVPAVALPRVPQK